LADTAVHERELPNGPPKCLDSLFLDDSSAPQQRDVRREALVDESPEAHFRHGLTDRTLQGNDTIAATQNQRSATGSPGKGHHAIERHLERRHCDRRGRTLRHCDKFG
jgi:hypothetical protein